MYVIIRSRPEGCAFLLNASIRLAVALFGVVFLYEGRLLATDIVIHLPEMPTVSRQSVFYQCDSIGPKIGVPAGSFPVEYINGGGNSLVVVRILGNSLIFSNVSSGSGARYTAQQYTWWEAKNSVVLYSDSLNGKLQTSCQPVPHK